MSVKPPIGPGRVRLLEIEGVDLQPCGGTHIARTGEIGPVQVGEDREQGQAEPARSISPSRIRDGETYAHPESLVSTAGSPSISPTPTSGRRRQLLPPDAEPQRARRIRQAAYPRRRLLRHRRDRRHARPPAPHAAEPRRNSPRAVRKLGLGDGNRIVVYNSRACSARRGSGGRSGSSAIRTWPCWTAACRNGWRRAGRSTTGPPQPRERHFTARFDHSQLRSKAQMLANIGSGVARCWTPDPPAASTPASRSLAGPAQRPHPGQPQPALHRSAGSRRQDPAARRAAQAKFRGTGIDLARPVVASCGSA